MRDASIAAHRNGDNAPGEGRQRSEVNEGILTHRAASPSPELNYWVNSPTLSPYRLMLTEESQQHWFGNRLNLKS
ncbi:hypothetical protein EYF80_034042 [Liparis tanakae]|uniref:Uncharacterized protein n=1 Tax=Liparis tanakae TaxID=230148 RepID=A0A4Z2GSP5_9TELE|nr:hypothetical protein EYF80_034042 [Liparis tanakae]